MVPIKSLGAVPSDIL